MQTTRVYDPNEEIPFHVTAQQYNLLLALIETTTGFPLRETLPLRVKLLSQLEAPPSNGADDYAAEVVTDVTPVVTASRRGKAAP